MSEAQKLIDKLTNADHAIYVPAFKEAREKVTVEDAECLAHADKLSE